ncbi:MAG: aconitate hydratase [Planctomycetes bacterium]|nr:aconitate hydratase [Planctomycetota bacterium]
MGMNLIEKIIADHLAGGRMAPGEEVGIRIDQTLTQDATGTMAFLEFEAMGVPRVRTRPAVSYVDHNTLGLGFENADDHAYLEDAAAAFGAHYSRAGNGICHELHLQRFARPGATLLGSDSHTPNAGGIGSLAIGAGGLDVAAAMGGVPFWIPAPRVILVRLTGSLRPWVSAKDIILEVLRILTTKGNVGAMLEYGGDGVATLDVQQRATIANMNAEMGATASVFPSDERTRRYLEAQGRGGDFRPLAADPGARYDREIDIDLERLEPMVAKPHSPDNVVPVREIAGLRCDQVLIGSCTNASLRDLTIVARALRGRFVAPNVSFAVAPSSRQTIEALAADGGLAALVAAGARLLEPACGFCIGQGMVPATDAVSVRTINRNFLGRCGSARAGVYLVSPEAAAACAAAGAIADPREVFAEVPWEGWTVPDRYPIDDRLIVAPPPEGTSVAIRRGPNIGPPPDPPPAPDAIDGEVAIRVGDKITTDHIMPAGGLLKYRSNIPVYAKYVFQGVDPSFADRALANKRAGRPNLIVGGESYGQGSSREHAALCPMFLGVRAVIAKTMERIHRANLINFGVLPLLFERPDDYDGIAQGDVIRIDGILEILRAGAPYRFVLEDRTRGTRIPLVADWTDRERDILLAGGRLRQLGAER